MVSYGQKNSTARPLLRYSSTYEPAEIHIHTIAIYIFYNCNMIIAAWLYIYIYMHMSTYIMQYVYTVYLLIAGNSQGIGPHHFTDKPKTWYATGLGIHGCRPWSRRLHLEDRGAHPIHRQWQIRWAQLAADGLGAHRSLRVDGCLRRWLGKGWKLMISDWPMELLRGILFSNIFHVLH